MSLLTPPGIKLEDLQGYRHFLIVFVYVASNTGPGLVMLWTHVQLNVNHLWSCLMGIICLGKVFVSLGKLSEDSKKRSWW